ncbi:hypothetical protein [Limosilactobacillus sp.]|uniref:hypothetical protein n=1 Tax=Limosilactobacillus sp. TaxID=2773925 RepID=UPI00345EDD6F
MKHILQVVIIVAFLALTLTGGISIDRFRSSLNPNKTVRIVGQVKRASQQFFLQHPQLNVKQP